jgi:hypothetical protein
VGLCEVLRTIVVHGSVGAWKVPFVRRGVCAEKKVKVRFFALQEKLEIN